MRLKIGGTYLTSGYMYHVSSPDSNQAIYQAVVSASQGRIPVSGDISDIGRDSGESAGFSLTIRQPDISKNQILSWSGEFYEADRAFIVSGAAGNTTAGVLTGVRFFSEGANISGIFQLYGVVK
jgi:hypothetical protein